MNKFFAYLLGAGWGAGIMYFLDPDQGHLRQSLITNRFLRIRREADTVMETGVRDLRNRAKGILYETAGKLSNEQADDWVLAERARAKLGTLTRHSGAMQIDVHDRRIILSGDALEKEADTIVKGMASVHGIAGLENNLSFHEEAGDIQSLRDTGMEMSKSSLWSPSTRLIAGVGSAYLLLRGRKGGFFGPFYTLGGIALGMRTVTNLSLKKFLGMETEEGAINVVKSINLDSPISEVYAMWSNFEMFPMFMEHVKEINSDTDGVAHWIVAGPVGIPLEFDTIVTQDIPENLLRWETIPGSQITHSGQVRFRENETGGTQVNVRMMYTPPAGAIGHAVAALFGADPKQAMDDDLARLKSLLEEGETSAEGAKIFQEDLNSL